MAPPIYFLFKKYSVEIKRWLSAIFHIPRLDRTNAKVKVVYATPERAIAKYVVPLRNKTTDIPVISFYLANFNYQPEKNTIGENLELILDKDNNVARRMRPLQVYQLTYVINVWTKLQIDMDIVLYQLLSQFTPMRWLAVDSEIDYQEYDFLKHPVNGPYQNGEKRRPGQWVPLRIDSVTDTSNLEPGEAGERVIRTDINLVCDWAYLPIGGYEYKSIKSVVLDFPGGGKNQLVSLGGISVIALSQSDYDYLISHDQTWLPSVDKYTDLPLTGNSLGDIRRVTEETTEFSQGEPYIFINFQDEDIKYYRPAVISISDLPTTNNVDGDIRYVSSEDEYYIWNMYLKKWNVYNGWIKYKNYLSDLII